MNNVLVSIKEIKKDVLKSILFDLFRTVRWIALILFAAVVEWAFLPKIPLIAIFSIPVLVEVVLCVIDLCILFNGKKIKISTDILSNKQVRIWPYRKRGTFARPARLFFNYEGRYDLRYDLTYYSWSSINVMTEKGLYESSRIEDVFTVVKIRNKIRAVYNHRLFDVQVP